MGLINFAKNAGAKILGRETSAEKEEAANKRAAEKAERAKRIEAAKERAEEAQKAAAVNKRKAELKEKAGEYRKAAELEAYVQDLGLSVKGLDIDFDDGKVEIEGEAADQETREKVVLAVGNVEGVESVDDKMSAPAAPEARYHTVVSGDTLSAIAKTYLGDASKYPVIFEANKPMLDDPDKIFPGQVLRIPEA